MKIRLAALIFAAVATSVQAEERLQRYEYRQRLMGVDFNLALYARDKSAANAGAKAAFQRIQELNGLFSDYDPNSELMRMCRQSGPGKPVKVSRELFDILHQSLAYSKQTGGAFDVTVGHLTRLWRRARRRKEFPKAEDLKDALAQTGWQHVRLHPKTQSVELLKSDMRLDLGGIAKGYAGDEALAVLKKRGITRAMVDASGDIVVGDQPPGKDAWVIAVAPLSRKHKDGVRYLKLKNCSVATSGDAYQYVVIAGKRYSHIVNPKTGLGLTLRSSVTIIAPTGTAADALASAVSVLGPDKGVTFAAGRKDVEASVAFLRDGKAVTIQTCGLRRYLRR